jgi:hypothetical protein
MLRMIEYLSACFASSGSSSQIRIPSTLVAIGLSNAGFRGGRRRRAKIEMAAQQQAGRRQQRALQCFPTRNCRAAKTAELVIGKWFHQLMAVKKFRAVDQSPGQIHNAITSRCTAGLKVRLHYFHFVCGRKARQDDQINSVGDVARSPSRLRLSPHQAALFDLVQDMA